MGKLERRGAVAGPAKGPVTDFDSSPSFLISAIGNKLAVIAARNLRKLVGLSLMEWKVLAVLGAEPAAAPGRIIEVSGVNKAAVSRAVTALERRGLVIRGPSPDHGLRTRLYLTAAGQEVHDRGIGARIEAEQQLLSGLSPADRTRLVDALRRITLNLGPMSDGR